jgi:4'-phosphopantetheinyl transferase
VSTVEVWQVELAQPAELVRRLEAVLSAGERERAGALTRADAAQRWIVARAALRMALGARLGAAPEDVEFATGSSGKPWLPGAALCFNISHSGDRALLALADGVEVGVDVERTSRSSRAVERALTPGERDALGAGDRHTELLQVWCRKEALAKAMGSGLGWAPETFDTSAPGGYGLLDLAVDEGYVAALAVAGGAAEVILRRAALR